MGTEDIVFSVIGTLIVFGLLLIVVLRVLYVKLKKQTNSSVNELRQTISKVIGQNEQLSDHVTVLRQIVTSLNAELAELSNENKTLHIEVSKLSKEVSTLAEKHSS